MDRDEAFKIALQLTDHLPRSTATIKTAMWLALDIEFFTAGPHADAGWAVENMISNIDNPTGG